MLFINEKYVVDKEKEFHFFLVLQKNKKLLQENYIFSDGNSLGRWGTGLNKTGSCCC